MEDYKLLLYILAAVAYFLFSAWRKAFKATDEEAEAKPQPMKEKKLPPKPVTPAAPSTSFEDILRELQPKLERAKEQAQTIREQIKPEQANPVISYEAVKPKAVSLEEAANSRESTRRMEELRKQNFKPYAIQQPEVSPYAKLLRNPNSVREAFILSEIFQRKYN